jgi:hypothetical protein
MVEAYKVFHYTKLNRWESIKSRAGLRYRKRLGQDYFPAWEMGGIFCFLDPTPLNWVDNLHFPEIWNIFLDGGAELLLEVDLDLESNHTFVIDRAHIEGFLYEEKENIPKKYLHCAREEAEKHYLESGVCIKNYLENEIKLDFCLPEVIITEHVPIEKIRLSSYQPVLEKKLKAGKNSDLSNYDYRKIEMYVPELSHVLDYVKELQ